MNIDLNCDLGEGCGHDAELLDVVTTANVCCGFHAGDAHTSLRTIEEAVRRGVRVGAHPGYDDKPHFGRRELQLGYEAIYAAVSFQVGGLKVLAETFGISLSHVKPHGALYNQACRDANFALPVLAAVCQWSMPILALPDSTLEKICQPLVVREGFADRRYQADGSLVPRDRPNALIEDAGEAVDQAERLMREHGVQSICVHGDNPRAVEFARRLRDELTRRGHSIRSFV